VWSSEANLWRQALQSDPANPRAQGNYCAALAMQGDLADVLRAYQRAHKHTGGFQAELAGILREVGYKDEAMLGVRRALATNPDDEGAHALLGQLLLERGEPDSAYRELRRLTPAERSPDALWRLAMAERARGDTLGARRLLDTLVVENGGYAEPRPYLYAYYLAGCGRDADAVAEWARALAQGDTSYAVLTGYAVSLAETGQTAEAERLFEQCAARYPTMWEAHHNLGYAYIRRERYPEAIGALERALETGGPHPALLTDLAYCQLMAGDTASADTALRRIAGDFPTYHPAYGLIGRLYLRDGDLDRARSFLERYRLLHAQEPDAYGSLGDLWRARGEPTLAKQYYLAAIAKTDGKRESIRSLERETSILADSLARRELAAAWSRATDP
jgi:Flp pilus assembly protein TadD